VSSLRGALEIVIAALVTAVAASAVATTRMTHRPRAAWLLLPLPVASLSGSVFGAAATFAQSWFVNVTIVSMAEALRLLGALIVTYALLNRRVLEFEFVLSRTLVVAAVSLIAVASFVLLDWALGTFLAGASHATGLVANGALALGLGLSLNAIQKRVTDLIDAVLFRKRRDDERALLEFAREAAYATDSEALLDRAIEKLEVHTDARGAALLLASGDAYDAVREFGDSVSVSVEENDAAILALKTWHKPLDPHHYATSMHGALALPMLERGRLSGVLLLGERAGGEAYSPGEVLALSTFTAGVASALGALSVERDETLEKLQASIAAMADAIAALRDAVASERRAGGVTSS
jgi:hypothetical protein